MASASNNGRSNVFHSARLDFLNRPAILVPSIPTFHRGSSGGSFNLKLPPEQGSSDNAYAYKYWSTSTPYLVLSILSTTSRTVDGGQVATGGCILLYCHSVLVHWYWFTGKTSNIDQTPRQLNYRPRHLMITSLAIRLTFIINNLLTNQLPQTPVLC